MKILLGTICLLLCQLFAANPVNAEQITDLLTGNTATESTTTPDKIITVNHSKQNDKMIEKRLQQIYSELDELKDVRASVSNGVVTLQGEISSKEQEAKAVQFANQMENVIEVENKLVVSRALNKRLNKTLNKIKVLGEQALAGLPLILLAFLVLWLFWFMGRWISNRQGFYRRISVNYFIADLFSKITFLIFIVIGIILALSLLDATALLGTILGAAGIFGLAIGFAVRDTVENFIASLLLSIRNPFEVNDFVDINGHLGNVARLTSRATILISPEGNHIRIPNSMVFKSVITNFTSKPERRFQFDLGIGTGQNLSQAQGLALDTLKALPGIMTEPKPQAIIQELGDSSVVMRIFGWVNQQQCDFLKVRSEAIKSVKSALDEANIVLPYPVYNLKISHDKDQSIEKTQEKVDSTKKVNIQKVELHTDEIKDITVDRTVEKQIEKENVQQNNENLLDPNIPDEI